MSIIVRREQLYEQVWSEPMVHVAKRYGISDVALAKICRKLNVPRPPVGYWAKRQHGYDLERTPLSEPPADAAAVAAVTPEAYRRLAPRRKADSALNTEKDAKSQPIDVGSRLVDPHPLVAKIGELLRNDKSGWDGMLAVRRGCVDVRVTPTMLDRALRITDAFLKAAQTRGFVIHDAHERPSANPAEVLPENVRVKLHEVMRRAPQLPTAKEEARHSLSRSSLRRPEYVPTGLLRLSITTSDGADNGTRKRWSDGREQRLESMLHEPLAELMVVVEEERLARQERERQRRAWVEGSRARAEAASRKYEEETRRQELVRQVEAWTRARGIRGYARAIEQSAVASGMSIEAGSEVRRWLDWVGQQADDADPVPTLLRRLCERRVTERD